MDVTKIASYSDEQINAFLEKISLSITSKHRGKEFHDALKQLYQLICIRGTREVDISNETIFVLFLSLQEEGMTRTKVMSSFLLTKLLDGALPVLEESLGGYENKTHVDLLLSLHIHLGSEQAFVNNLSTSVSFVLSKDYEMRNSSIPFLLHVSRHMPHIIKERNYIEPLENQFRMWLLNASKVAAKSSQSMNNIFNLKLSSKSQPVTELDGTPCKDIFTVSNETPYYAEDQIFNHISFSLLHTWLTSIYTPSQDEPTPKLSPEFRDAIIKYCLRVIEQSHLKPVGANEHVARRLPDMALIESIRILNLVCQNDSSVVKQCFSIVKKLFSLTRPAWNSRSNGFLFLVIMEFFLKHGDKTLFDVDPVFRQYFDSYIVQNYADPIIASESVWFCIQHKEELLSNSNIFSQHLHSLLRITAWHPFEFRHEFKQLIPTIIGPSTFLEVFHALLDLPLLSAALERMEPETPGKDIKSGVPIRTFSSINDGYRLLFTLLLRKESGVIINFWESSNTLNLLKSFLKDVYLTPRIRNTCKNVPDYLEMFFEVILYSSDNACIEQLLPAMFERMDQLFPYKPYERAVRKTLVNKILACFERCPHLIATYQKLIIDLLGDTAAVGREELVLHLVWAIGEYASDQIEEVDAAKLFSDYDEALELFAFERMNFAAMEHNQDFTTPSQIYNTRLMLITVSTLTKLASKWQPLATRVRLCLEKVIRYGEFFHASVIRSTKHCLNLLKYPSIASAMMGFSDEELEKNLIFPSQTQTQILVSDTAVQQKPLHDFVL